MAASKHDARNEPHAIEVETRLEIEVPRNGAGDLQDGIRSKLDRSATVDRITALEVIGIQPRLNDLSVGAIARFRTTETAGTVREDLDDIVGVRGVTVDAIDQVPADSPGEY